MVPVPGGRSITPLNSTTTTPAHEYTRSVFVGPGVQRDDLLMKGRPRPEAVTDHGPAISRKFEVRQLENIYREQNRVEQEYGIQVGLV